MCAKRSFGDFSRGNQRRKNFTRTFSKYVTIDNDQYFQINSLTAPIVVEAFQLYADGKSMKQIVDELNGRGIAALSRGKFNLNVVNRLLKNRRYVGEYRYREIVTPGGIPAIVPQELFDKVQERLAKNKKAPARHKADDDYLLTTKLICGHCGAYMVGESGTSHTLRVHHYYKCVSAKKRRGCKKKSVKKDWIEDLVVAEALKMLDNGVILGKIADSVIELQGQENTTLPLLKKQLHKVERGIDNMLNAVQAGVLNESTKKRLDDLEQSKSEIEVKILQEEMQKPLLTREQIMFWLNRFRGIDTTNREQSQRLIDTFVNSVYAYDDKLVLTFNYKDGSKTVGTAEIKGSFGSDLSSRGAP
ncbi:MAG: recombinase family protein [Clostridiales Family XIII bacterium]|jgi:hypothetical protein|nr:recombinase family protein [Clostridiales Family XIII bacterium]